MDERQEGTEPAAAPTIEEQLAWERAKHHEYRDQLLDLQMRLNKALGQREADPVLGWDEIEARAKASACTCPLICVPHGHRRPACVGCPEPVNCARHCFNKMGADGKPLPPEGSP
jgi:hypothetical protein